MATPGRIARRRRVRRMVLRPLGTVVLSVAAYYWLPLPDRSDAAALVFLVAGLALVGVVVVWHARAIVRSEYPRMRAIEALALAAPMFLMIFAATYFMLARASTGNFDEDLSRTDALYFTVTVFSTVGFGDITPDSGTARLLVTVQMIGDMIFLGFGIRLLLTATQRGLERRASTSVDHLVDDGPGRAG